MSEARVHPPRVTVVPPTLNRFTAVPVAIARKRRVAGYARVSTDLEEQLTSYEAQVDYYTRHIRENPEWEYAGIYVDQGISATSTKKRDGFNTMIRDALDGKIDLILTKSVSRFARNTVDSLTTVRMLKEKGVEVYFEKENIYTLDSKGELLITIMSSLAQEESRSISENVTWGQRKRFADGKVSLPYRQFLGYRKGADGLPEIVEEEAGTVRLIYRMFLEGKTPFGIAKYLSDQGVPTPAGKKNWRTSTVQSILANEKYKGDALLQKKFTVDFLTKKQKVNEGEVPQYYVENSHPGIVSSEMFDMVQREIARRDGEGKYHSGVSCFSGKIICGCCGSAYGSKVWHSNDRYRRVIWQCNHKYKNGEKCTTPHLDEETIKVLFVKVANQVLVDREQIIEDCELIRQRLSDTTSLDAEAMELHGELQVATELIRQLVDQNANSALDQVAYQNKYAALAARYQEAADRMKEIEEQCQQRKAKGDELNAFIAALMDADSIITEFNENLWNALVERVTVSPEEDILFILRNGGQIHCAYPA
jgi:DNA invertase Pin-like site-specific DNA recombinase